MTDISDYMDPARVDPTCKQHRPTKLYATPPKDATDLRLGAILGHYDDWYVCTCCGAVAYQGRRLRWGSIMSDDIKRALSSSTSVWPMPPPHRPLKPWMPGQTEKETSA